MITQPLSKAFPPAQPPSYHHPTYHPSPAPAPAPAPSYTPDDDYDDSYADEEDLGIDVSADNDDDDDNGNPLTPPRDYFPPPNIVRLLEDEGETTLLSLLEQVDLLEPFQKRGNFTLFAPTNAAFAKLDQDTIDKFRDDRDLLEKVLKHHVVPDGRIFSKIIKDDLLAETLDEESTLRFNVVDDFVTVNGAEVDLTRVDQRASNGVVHFIKDVMYPIPTNTIYELLNDDDRFVTLVRALEIADLVDLLNDDSGSLTIFAPTDAAFDLIPKEGLDELLADRLALR